MRASDAARFVVVAAVVVPSIARAQAFIDEALSRGVSYAVPYEGGFDYSFGYGVAFADLNSDGAPDLVTLGTSIGLVGVFKNDGAGGFTNLSATTGIPLLPRASGVTAADYDDDGDLDLFISCWCDPDVLLRNDGAFVFTDVTVGAGLDDAGAGAGSAWADVNGDGWLDLYLCNRTGTDCEPDATPGSPNRLYLNNGDGTFTDAATLWNADDPLAYSFQPGFFDFDDDGDMDLFVAEDKGSVDCEIGHNKLFRNEANTTFTEISAAAKVDGCLDGMCVTIGDLDRNGHFDVYVTNIPLGNELYMCNGDGTFSESASGAAVSVNHTSWGSIFFDRDNDGLLDLYVCNMDAVNSLFDNVGAFPMQPNASPGAAADAGLSFCAATADIDNDGDLDIALSTLTQPIRLLVNQNPATNEWVKLRVAGRSPNRCAIGAVARVHVGSTWVLRQVQAGSGYKSQDDLTLHVGLGGAASIDELIVEWPDGARRVYTGLPTRTTHVINPPCRADLDLDADTDIFDFAVLASGFGLSVVPGTGGDYDASGLVDVFDFAMLASDFGCVPD